MHDHGIGQLLNYFARTDSVSKVEFLSDTESVSGCCADSVGGFICVGSVSASVCRVKISPMTAHNKYPYALVLIFILIDPSI